LLCADCGEDTCRHTADSEVKCSFPQSDVDKFAKSRGDSVPRKSLEMNLSKTAWLFLNFSPIFRFWWAVPKLLVILRTHDDLGLTLSLLDFPKNHFPTTTWETCSIELHPKLMRFDAIEFMREIRRPCKHTHTHTHTHIHLMRVARGRSPYLVLKYILIENSLVPGKVFLLLLSFVSDRFCHITLIEIV